MNYRLVDKLHEPRKLIDILNFGIANPDLSTNCIGELLEQLYNSDKFHVLFALDGFNDWLKASDY
jgi:small subunit ribosomal protein S29